MSEGGYHDYVLPKYVNPFSIEFIVTVMIYRL